MILSCLLLLCLSPGDSFVLSENGCGRATGYAEANKIVTVNQKTHVCWLDSHSHGFFVKVRSWDQLGKTWSKTIQVGEAADNHGGPALSADSQGYLHLVYGPHHGPFIYQRSKKPGDSTDWTTPESLPGRWSYPSLVCANDDSLIITGRESRGRNWTVGLIRRNEQGWSPPSTLIRSEFPGYAHFQDALAFDSKGQTLHIVTRIYDGRPGFGHTVGYMRSVDQGASWTTSKGQPLSLPVTSKSIECLETRERGGAYGLRTGGFTLSPDGSPMILVTDYDQTPMKTWLLQESEGTWRKIDLNSFLPADLAGFALSTPGNMAVDDEGEVFIALTVFQADAKEAFGHPSSEVVLLRSKEGSDFQAELLSPKDPNRAHWLPSLERSTRPGPRTVTGLIYTDGPKGETNQSILQNRVIWVSL